MRIKTTNDSVLVLDVEVNEFTIGQSVNRKPSLQFKISGSQQCNRE